MAKVILAVFGAILTLVAFCIGFVTYVLPYWFEFYEIEKNDAGETVYGNFLSMTGFWAHCDLRNRTEGQALSECQWFFWNNFQIENTFPGK